MNLLHVQHHCIISKLDEIIGLIKPPTVNPKSDWFYAIITLIVCLTIVFVAYYAIKRFFDWKKTVQENEVDQKDKERLNQVKDKEFELKKEYQAKVLDYLKGEIDSYKKLPNLISELQKVSEKIDKLKCNMPNVENAITIEENKSANPKTEETSETINEKHIEKQDEGTTCLDVKKALCEILQTIKNDMEFWKLVFDNAKQGKCVFNKTDIIDQEKNLYLKTLNDYIENIQEIES